MRYFIRLAYKGASFHGWQIQPDDCSVQETLEQALSMVLRQEIALTGAGRTDAGVNAAMMVAHFDVDAEISNPDGLVHSLNGILPKDTAVYSVFRVHDDAHARFDATSRTYKYFTHSSKSPFLYPFSWHCPPTLDFDLMNQAAARLSDYVDFTSFSKLHTDVKTNNCRISEAHWDKVGEQWVFTITADRFLRNMVRAIVGTLVEVGRHKISVDEFCNIIEKKNRCAAGMSMPGNALFLWNITYPYPIK